MPQHKFEKYIKKKWKFVFFTTTTMGDQLKCMIMMFMNFFSEIVKFTAPGSGIQILGRSQ